MFLAKRQVYTFTTDPRDFPKDFGNKMSLHAVVTTIRCSAAISAAESGKSPIGNMETTNSIIT